MERELTLRIVLEKPPAGVDFGVQKGRGNDYETMQKQRSKAGDLHFEFTVRAKQAGKGDFPNFLGPIVQGPKGERFIYIDIGTCAGQIGTIWSRRLKIPLRGITWEMIDQATASEHSIIETRVNGTGKDGGPTCGTVKPFAGWKVSEARP
ncbi:MAG: hypothetical protein QOD75_1161 [Blastocatellia bacterium]|jgi:hypothetical protein|nr:hypothetical protein [Blastocatellia bacterium]